METQAITQEQIKDGRSTAIIAYITFVGLIIAFVQNNESKNAFAAYHIRQSLGLMCTSLALGFINIIPILGQIIFLLGMLFLFVLWVLGLMNAINEKKQPIPILGTQYNKWFASI